MPRYIQRLTASGRTILVSIGVLSLVLAGVLVSSGVPSAFAGTSTGRNLITNGCFQVPGLTSGEDTFVRGSTQITGWTLGGDSVDVKAANWWEAVAGCSQSVDLAGDASGALSQTVSTTPGVSYLLQWEMAGNPDGGPAVKTMHVFWEGKLVAAPTFNTTGHSDSSMGWVSMHVTVHATDTRSVVTFADASAGDTDAGATLDAVSLTVQFARVNGFSVTSASDPYSVAVRQMLAKVPESAVVPASGVPVCTLQALAAEQVKNGAGLLIFGPSPPRPSS
jgi:choice-of-anchor C domain-containing protein